MSDTDLTALAARLSLSCVLENAGAAVRLVRWPSTRKNAVHAALQPGTPPTLAGVLACLLRDASAGADSFEAYCAARGLSTDSRAAHHAWKACVRTRAGLAAMFTREELAELARAACERS